MEEGKKGNAIFYLFLATTILLFVSITIIIIFHSGLLSHPSRLSLATISISAPHINLNPARVLWWREGHAGMEMTAGKGHSLAVCLGGVERRCADCSFCFLTSLLFDWHGSDQDFWNPYHFSRTSGHNYYICTKLLNCSVEKNRSGWGQQESGEKLSREAKLFSECALWCRDLWC